MTATSTFPISTRGHDERRGAGLYNARRFDPDFFEEFQPWDYYQTSDASGSGGPVRTHFGESAVAEHPFIGITLERWALMERSRTGAAYSSSAERRMGRDGKEF